jgi:hypothetical protein
MGLSLEVGILADLKANDADGFEFHKAALERLNPFLKSHGLPYHNEPHNCEVWSGQMISYSGLHDVRRIAAYLDAGRPLPPPSDQESSNDPCLEGYFALVERRQLGIFRRLFGAAPAYRREFDHLILHSDAEGYYLPIDFSDVLFPPADLEIPGGGIVGSAPRLLAELDRLALALAIPSRLTADSEELWEAGDAPASDGDLWKRFGRESLGCVTLREGCRRAIAEGAALVFT